MLSTLMDKVDSMQKQMGKWRDGNPKNQKEHWKFF